MHETLSLICDFETAMGELYRAFARHFADDGSFWEQLAREEDAHAASVERAIQALVWESGSDDAAMREAVERERRGAQLLVERASAGKVRDRREALELAHRLETSACELHGRRLLREHQHAQLGSLLDALLGHDQEHARRIQQRLDRLANDPR